MKEYPYILEKSLTSDSEMLPFSCAAVKTLRKASCDVRSLCSEGIICGQIILFHL